MTVYRIGWKGPEIERIQIKLKELGHYQGSLDGDFGGGTLRAVKAYQRYRGLKVDGIVGPETWASLFDGEPMSTPAIIGEPLVTKGLALTGSFETGRMPPECFAGLSGDFDGQGISFGALQWNFGKGSLQPLLLEMNTQYESILRDVFDEEYQTLLHVLEDLDKPAQMKWARSITSLSIPPSRNLLRKEAGSGRASRSTRSSRMSAIQRNPNSPVSQSASLWIDPGGEVVIRRSGICCSKRSWHADTAARTQGLAGSEKENALL